jgi:hypothetical protein
MVSNCDVACFWLYLLTTLYFAFSDERTKNALKEFSSIDVNSNFLDARQAHPGTGSWFLQGQVFGKWLLAKGGLVWLYGIRKLRTPEMLPR